MEFFDELKRLCRIKGITVDELMKMIGKSGISIYAGWRQRNRLPRADDFAKICKVLEVSMEHFFDDESGIVVRQEMIEFVKKMEKLSPEDFSIMKNLTTDQLENLISLAKSMKP